MIQTFGTVASIYGIFNRLHVLRQLIDFRTKTFRAIQSPSQSVGFRLFGLASGRVSKLKTVSDCTRTSIDFQNPNSKDGIKVS